MDTRPDATPAPAAPAFAALLRDVYIAPSEAFTELSARPRFMPALVGFVLTQVAFIATWLAHMDFLEFMRAQAEAGGQAMPPATALSPATIAAFKWMMGVSGAAFSVLLALAIAGLLLVVFNFLLGARASYAQCLAVVAWTAFATHLVLSALMLAVMALRGEWSVPPDQVLQAGAAALLERGSTGRFWYSLAQSCDVFSAWMVALASIGMARAARLPTSSAAGAVLALWLIGVLGKAALAALF